MIAKIPATLSWTDIAVRLALAIAAGFLVGLERGMHAHRVGLRTTMLVVVAAAVAMIQANWLMVLMPDTQVSTVRFGDLLSVSSGAKLRPPIYVDSVARRAASNGNFVGQLHITADST